ncbi:type II toxin-antitoxin system ParD family antitoxin [uncultured Enterovirga sp.]|uniref:ribbon-helix-helix domain-containing protein n=1 Tax=uncultured Enterovirga sp. TaxID=2026352 RepID=UPI0035CC98CC
MPRTIHLMPDFEASLDRMVESGRYGETAGDVLMYAIAALEDQEAIREAREARLRAQLEEGLADIREGRTVPAEQVFRDLRQKIIGRAAEGRDAAE